MPGNEDDEDGWDISVGSPIGNELPNMPISVDIKLTKIAMSEEDALFYRLTNGYAPAFRIEKVPYKDENNELKLRYILTNIPKADK